jgi:hypothetical protein
VNARPCLKCGKRFTPTADWQEFCSADCRRTSAAAKVYEDALAAFPPPREGNHGHLLTCANLGVFAGLSDSKIEADLVRCAKRKPTPAELAATIANARATAGKNSADPAYSALTAKEKEELRAKRAAARELEKRLGKQAAVEAVRKLAGPPLPLVDLMRMSPAIEPGAEFTSEQEQRQNAALMLATLYAPQELVYIGGKYDTGREFLHASSDLQAAILDGAEIPPFCIVNPFTGSEGRTKNGKPSFRADECISALRYALYEVDLAELPIETQAAFIASRIRKGWPVVSVVFSGGKSLHALLKVDCRDAEQWQAEVRDKLFPRLAEFGGDTANKNPSRLSRLPGGRHKSGNLSALVYLNPAHGAPGLLKSEGGA